MKAVRELYGDELAVLPCAYQGNAAFNLEFGGATLHGSFGINSRNVKHLELTKGTPAILAAMPADAMNRIASSMKTVAYASTVEASSSRNSALTPMSVR